MFAVHPGGVRTPQERSPAPTPPTSREGGLCPPVPGSYRRTPQRSWRRADSFGTAWGRRSRGGSSTTRSSSPASWSRTPSGMRATMNRTRSRSPCRSTHASCGSRCGIGAPVSIRRWWSPGRMRVAGGSISSGDCPRAGVWIGAARARTSGSRSIFPTGRDLRASLDPPTTATSERQASSPGIGRALLPRSVRARRNSRSPRA
jgi:hypothetical protein